MKLYTIAHSRAGDKGNILTLSLIPFVESDYALLCEKVTAEKVNEHFKGLFEGNVVRYELPGIWSLVFVCSGALNTGVTTSLRVDPHGKTLSYALLEMEI